MRLIEEQLSEKEIIIDKNDSEVTKMNTTFVNPSMGFPCEKCDFNANSKGGLQLHIRSKHKEIIENSDTIATIDPEIVVIESLIEN
jgi:hypothetical protein